MDLSSAGVRIVIFMIAIGCLSMVNCQSERGLAKGKGKGLEKKDDNPGQTTPDGGQTDGQGQSMAKEQGEDPDQGSTPAGADPGLGPIPGQSGPQGNNNAGGNGPGGEPVTDDPTGPKGGNTSGQGNAGNQGVLTNQGNGGGSPRVNETCIIVLHDNCAEGEKLPNAKNCKQYSLCRGGRWFTRACTGQRLFDAILKDCVAGNIATCYQCKQGDATPAPTDVPPPDAELPKYCEDSPVDGYLWKGTQPSISESGNSQDGDCPGSMTGRATRRCKWNPVRGAEWDDPDYSLCVTQEFKEISEKVEKIKKEPNLPTPPGKPAVPSLLVEETIIELEGRVKQEVEKPNGMSGGNLNVSLEALDVVTGLADEKELNFTDPQTVSMAYIAGTLLSKLNTKGWEAIRKRTPDRGSVIMKSVDRIAQQLSRKLRPGTKLTYTVSTFEIMLESKPKDSHTSFEFEPKLPPGEIIRPGILVDKVVLDKDTLHDLEDIIPGDAISVWSTYYYTLNDFLPTVNDEIINSRIMSLSVLRLPDGQKLYPPVSLQFSAINGSIDTEAMCKFWQFLRHEGGEWSNVGCRTVSYNASGTLCACDHLTNFAVLMSPYPIDEKHAAILDLISVIGCLLSILGMFVTISLYILSWKRVKSHHAAVLINLCIALIIANTVFLAGVKRTENKVICMAIAGMLHFFYLVAFFMMFADGVQFILYVVKVFHVRRKRETFLLILTCWFLPAVIVAVTMSITRGEGYGTDDYCWLRKDNGLIAAFVVPALLVMLVNFCILCVILRTITNSKGSERKNRVKATIWNIAVMMPLLGLTWVFGIFSVNESTVYFQYVFAICNSLQGFFIFFFHCALNKKMRQAVVERFSSRSSQSSSLQERRNKKNGGKEEQQNANNQSAPAFGQTARIYQSTDSRDPEGRGGTRARTPVHGAGRSQDPAAPDIARSDSRFGTSRTHPGDELESGVSYTDYGTPDSRSRPPTSFFYGGDEDE